MGSNMQRQAVLACVREKAVRRHRRGTHAIDPGTVVTAHRGGKVDYVDASRVVIRVSDAETAAGDVGVDIYNWSVHAFQPEHNINQRPLVTSVTSSPRGDVIADGASTDKRRTCARPEHAGRFMPWNGYNYEDSDPISERAVAQDRWHVDSYRRADRWSPVTPLGPGRNHA